MADKSLLPQNNKVSNGCIVAAINTNTLTLINHNDTKLLNHTITDGSNNHLNNCSKTKHEYMNEPPPDGGARAWCVMISAFLCNSILFGIINTYGVIYLSLHEKLTEYGDLEASSKAGDS